MITIWTFIFTKRANYTTILCFYMIIYYVSFQIIFFVTVKSTVMAAKRRHIDKCRSFSLHNEKYPESTKKKTIVKEIGSKITRTKNNDKNEEHKKSYEYLNVEIYQVYTHAQCAETKVLKVLSRLPRLRTGIMSRHFDSQLYCYHKML